MTTPQERQDQILELNQTLLNSIAAGDFPKYTSLCADDITCFEPETTGVLVQGISFHKYYFDLDEALSSQSNHNDAVVMGQSKPKALPITNVSMSNPHCRWLGDDAVVITYTRLDQKLVDNSPVTKATSETRVWEKRDGKWLHVHLHKS